MAIQLTVLDGPGAGAVHHFSLSCIWIGSSPNCELIPTGGPTGVLEARHAMVLSFGQSYQLRDTSTGGTYVQGRRIERQSLQDGDVIQLGRGGPRVRFQLVQAVAEAAPVQPPAAASALAAPPARRHTRVWLWVLLGLALGLGCTAAIVLVVILGQKPDTDPPPDPPTATAPVVTPPPASTPRPPAALEAVTGAVKLPAGFETEAAQLQVHSPSQSAPLKGGSYQLQTFKVDSRLPPLVLATPAGKPVLLGQAGGDLSPRSTALALVMLDPAVTRLKPPPRAGLRRRVEADRRLGELAALIDGELTRDPKDPLGGTDSDGVYRLAARITGDALRAAAPSPGHQPHAAGAEGPARFAGFVEHDQKEAAPGAPPLYIKDDVEHKTGAVLIFNTTFSYYKVSISRDGAPVKSRQNVLLHRNKPYTFAHLKWPPFGGFYTERPVLVGNGELVFSFRQYREMCYFDFFSTFASTILGVSALPKFPAERDIRIVMTALSKAPGFNKDLVNLIDYCGQSHSLKEIANQFAIFFGWHGVTIGLAFSPLIKNTFRDKYIEIMGKFIAKKFVFALTAGYGGIDMATLMWSLAKQPQHVTLRGEQRFNVWPAVKVKILLRERPETGAGRLFDIALKIDGPSDLKPLEVVLTYPGDPDEDRLPSIGGIDSVLHQHRFVKATEVRVRVNRKDTGAQVAEAAATIPGKSQVVAPAEPGYPLRPGVWKLGRGFPREVVLRRSSGGRLRCGYASSGQSYTVVFRQTNAASRRFRAVWRNPAPGKMAHWDVHLDGTANAGGTTYRGTYSRDFKDKTGGGRKSSFAVEGKWLRDYKEGKIDSGFDEVDRPAKPPKQPVGSNPYSGYVP